jgi:hypothetical protein
MAYVRVPTTAQRGPLEGEANPALRPFYFFIHVVAHGDGATAALKLCYW